MKMESENKNKSILIVSAVFPPEPVVSAMISYDLAERLALDYNVVVLCPKPTRPLGKKLVEEKNIRYKFHRIVLDSYTHPASDFIGRMIESLSFGRKTAKYIKKHRKEIGLVYMNTWPIFAQYAVLSISHKLKIPTIIHIQDIYPESMIGRLGIIGKIIGKCLSYVDKYEMRKANHVFAISENMKNYLIHSRGISRNQISVVRNWQNDAYFEINNYTPNEQFTFMFVGSVSPAAGVLFIIKSFVKSNIKKSKLIIAGDGSDKQMCIDYVQANHCNNIEFISVAPKDVALLQSKADVLLLPLKKGIGATASPSKLTAYLFSAKPIIACVDKNTDVEMIIKEARCGWVCEPENQEMLSECMNSVSKMHIDNLKEKGDAARAYAIEHFSKQKNLSSMIDKIELMYNEKR